MALARIAIARILCPVDFSEFSLCAFEHAVALGRWFDARVSVLHVIPYVVTPDSGLPSFVAPLYATEFQRAEAEQQLADLGAPFRAAGVALETRVAEGEPWWVIGHEADALPADLLVMGTHGRGGFEHLLLGSVTEKVLRRAPCPVLTMGNVATPPRSGPLFRSILCATDLTEASAHTVEAALSLAGENAAEVTLLHVIESLAEASGSIHLRLAVPEIGPLRHYLTEQAAEKLRRFVPEGTRDWCFVREQVEVGAAWRAILRVAEETGAGLIVMGAHAHGVLARAFFGSTSSHVVRQAGCPVLVVRETSHPRRREAPLVEEWAAGHSRGGGEA